MVLASTHRFIIFKVSEDLDLSLPVMRFCSSVARQFISKPEKARHAKHDHPTIRGLISSAYVTLTCHVTRTVYRSWIKFPRDEFERRLKPSDEPHTGNARERPTSLIELRPTQKCQRAPKSVRRSHEGYLSIIVLTDGALVRL